MFWHFSMIFSYIKTLLFRVFCASDTSISLIFLKTFPRDPPLALAGGSVIAPCWVLHPRLLLQLTRRRFTPPRSLKLQRPAHFTRSNAHPSKTPDYGPDCDMWLISNNPVYFQNVPFCHLSLQLFL